MKFWKKAFDLYINSSFHVGLALVAFTLVTIMEFGLSPDFDLLMFVFFGTITSYNFVKYAGIAKLHHPSLVTESQTYPDIFIFLFSRACLLQPSAGTRDPDGCRIFRIFNRALCGARF